MSIKKTYMHSRINRLDDNSRQIAAEREIRTVKSLLKNFYDVDFKKFKTIVDYGCGDRFLENELIKKGFDYKGFDVNNFDFNFEPAPLKDNSVDLVISLAVIEHLKRPEKMLSESFRVLKPGGCIYLTTPNWHFDSKNFYNDYTHITPFTPNSLKMILTDIGFRSPNMYPGLRCKHKWFYKGKNRFRKAFFLFPFSGNNKYVPKFLKGHARSIIGIAFKPYKKVDL